MIPVPNVRTRFLLAATAVAVPFAMLATGTGTAMAQPPGGGTDFIGPTAPTPSLPQACLAACLGVGEVLGGGNLVNPAGKAFGSTPIPTGQVQQIGPGLPSTGGGVNYTIPGGGPNGNLGSGTIPAPTGSFVGGDGDQLVLPY